MTHSGEKIAIIEKTQSQNKNFLNLDLPRGISVQSAYLNEFEKVKDVYAGYLQALSQNSENTVVFFTEPSEEKKVHQVIKGSGLHI